MQNKLKNKQLISLVFISILISSFFCFLYDNAYFFTWASVLNDLLYKNHEVPVEDKIIVLEIDDQSIQQIGRWPWSREIFAELIEKTQNARAIGVDVMFAEPSTEKEDEYLIEAVNLSSKVFLPIEFSDILFLENRVLAQNLLIPFDDLYESRASFGAANLIPDKDGVLRKTVQEYVYQDKIYPSYAKQILDFTGYSLKQGDYLINFTDEQGFNRYPVYEIFSDGFDSQVFEDSIVLIGATAPDLHDDVATPIDRKMPGVYAHANILNTAIKGNYFTTIPLYLYFLILFSINLSILYLISRFNIWVSAVFYVSEIFVIVLLTALAIEFNFLISLFYILLAAVISYIVGLLFKYFYLNREKYLIKKTFARYVSPEVVREILRNPEEIRLGGRKYELTVFFSDIKGFTSISENMKPDELIELLNKYLSKMTNLILENEGVVDKYMGDGIMAFWGAPLPSTNHAVKAVYTAVQMFKILDKLNRELSREADYELSIRIGINTGEAIAGNVGSERKLEYTLIGDCVNLASRLESLNKVYGSGIIISQNTKNKIGDDFLARSLEKVQVKGKEEAVNVYQIMGFAKDFSKDEIEAVNYFNRAQKFYEEKDFNMALNLLKKSMEIINDDTAAYFLSKYESCLADPANYCKAVRMNNK